MKQKRDKKLRLGNNESLPTLDTAKDPMLNSEYEFNKALYENPVSLIQKYNIIYNNIGACAIYLQSDSH